jgi:hypothetical protein
MLFYFLLDFYFGSTHFFFGKINYVVGQVFTALETREVHAYRLQLGNTALCKFGDKRFTCCYFWAMASASV